MQVDTNRHLDEIEVEKYSRGETAESELPRLEEHLLICEHCMNRVTESDNLVDSMVMASAQKRREETETKPLKWFSFPRLTPAFALFILLLVVTVSAVLWVGNHHDRGSPPVPFAVSLAAIRGQGPAVAAPAGRPLALQLDLTGIPAQFPLRLEVVDHLGGVVWQGAAVSQDAKAVANIPALAAGTYFVRAYSTAGQLLREFGLNADRR